MYFATGNPPITSTFASATDPSTAALLAELDSSNFKYGTLALKEHVYQVHAYLGGSTGAYWIVERSASTALNSAVEQYRVRTASGQTSQFVFKFKSTAVTDRIRVRHVSSVSGTFDATLCAEELI
jgi:hypothetical protein